jgi:hypothetical protein
VWLISSLLFLASAVTLLLWPRGWWAIGAVAVVASTFAIRSSWAEARAGMLLNVLIVVGLVIGFVSQGPFSLRAEYDRDVRRFVTDGVRVAPIVDSDLNRLPVQVQRYLRFVGALGQPAVQNFRVRMHGRIRNDRHGRWMRMTAEQYDVVTRGARLFFLNAATLGIPIQAYHRYADSSASMRVLAAGLVPVASASGAEMTQSETVTLFNDMCLMAPATLIDHTISWETVDEHAVNATFTHAGHTVHATLVFDSTGALKDFVSDDRSQESGGGKAMKRVRWSTPIHGYRIYGNFRLPSGGEGVWQDAEGAYDYIDLQFDEVLYNVTPR